MVKVYKILHKKSSFFLGILFWDGKIPQKSSKINKALK